MKSGKLNAFIRLIVIILFSQQVWAQKKLAQTGFQFLSVIPDARAAAMANAMTTVPNGAGALWNNPAMLAGMDKMLSFEVSQNKWIADIEHNALSFAFCPAGGQYGVVGVSLLLVDYGEVEGTIVANNEQGFIETGIIKPSAYAIGIAYAKALTNKFFVGAHFKYVSQYLGPAIDSYSMTSTDVKISDQRASAIAVDFGTQYRTGFKSLVFGMSLRNFSKEIKYSVEEFQLPLSFNIGFSANVMDFMPDMLQNNYISKLLLTVDAVHPRSYPEYVKTGLEYVLADFLSLRLGYYSNVDERSFTYGIGLSEFGFKFDYAYVPFGIFNNVQRFTLRFSW